MVDSFGMQVQPAASMVPQGRAAATVGEAFEAAFGSPTDGMYTNGREERLVGQM